MDTYATHKTHCVQRWLAKHPRYCVHFTPTSGSWLNQVEWFYTEISAKRIRRWAFRCLPLLEKANMNCVAQHYQNPARSRGPRTPK